MNVKCGIYWSYLKQLSYFTRGSEVCWRTDDVTFHQTHATCAILLLCFVQIKHYQLVTLRTEIAEQTKNYDLYIGQTGAVLVAGCRNSSLRELITVSMQMFRHLVFTVRSWIDEFVMECFVQQVCPGMKSTTNLETVPWSKLYNYFRK
jgi:hypothetical protein